MITTVMVFIAHCNWRVEESDNIALRLAEYLYSFELLITDFRELSRTTSVKFSFVDDAPGSLKDTLCLHVTVDMPSRNRLDDYDMALFPIKDIVEKLAVVSNKTLAASLARLLQERE